MSARRRWIVGATHEAFGFYAAGGTFADIVLEGSREVVCTEIGARRIAASIARRAGYGWRPYVSEAAE